MIPAREPSTTDHPRWLYSAVLVTLALTAVGALALRIPSIAEPLGIDQSLWASAVRGMSRGQLLYRDVWEQRPPGIYWVYLAGFQVLGWRTATVAWLDIVAAAAMTWLLFAIVRRLSTELTAVLTAALYSSLTMPAWLYGNAGFLERSVCETFIIVCVGAAVWCVVRLRGSGSAVLAVGLGLFSGAAVVLKPNAGLYFPALVLWLFLYRHRQSAVRVGAQTVLLAVTAAAIVPLLAIVWLWSLGTLAEAKVAVLDFNRYYVGQGFSPATYAIDFSNAAWLRIKTDPLWLAGAVASLVAVVTVVRERTVPAVAGLGILWGAAAALVIVVNGARLFTTYFINALPPLALMAGWLLGESWSNGAQSLSARRAKSFIALAVIFLMIVQLLQRGGYAPRVAEWAHADMQMLRGRIDRVSYLERFGGYANARGYSARANDELAAFVSEHTSPDDRIFLLGINGAGVYFASNRLTAHRFLRVNFFVETDFPDPRFRLDAVVDELRASPPALLIFERLPSTSAMARAVDRLPQDPKVATLLERYRHERDIEDFTVFRRVD